MKSKKNLILSFAAFLSLITVVQAQFDDLYYNPDESIAFVESDFHASSYEDIPIYDDADYEFDDYDFYYTSRIKRFRRPYTGFGFYDPVYVDYNYYDPSICEVLERSGINLYAGTSIYINWGCFVVNGKSRIRSRLAYSRYNKWFNPYGYNNQFLGARFSWTNNNPYLNGVYNNPNWYNYSNAYCPPGYNGGANRARNATRVRNVNSNPRVTGSTRLSTTPSAVVVRRSKLKPVTVSGKAVSSRNFSLPKSNAKSIAANKRKAKSSADRKRATQNRLSTNNNRASQSSNNNAMNTMPNYNRHYLLNGSSRSHTASRSSSLNRSRSYSPARRSSAPSRATRSTTSSRSLKRHK